MKLLKCTLENFASYPNLEFEYNDQGLALIFGPTGSGKSTLLDAPCWILFGITAKDGSVDEVRSWQSPGAPTKGTLSVETPSGIIEVTRVRGRSSENDLYWEELGVKHRGKDITETQALLSQRLSVDADLYTTAAYFSEFSATTSFFTSKAKARREVFEKVASLSFPVSLAEKASATRKEVKKRLATAETTLSRTQGKLDALRNQQQSLMQGAQDFEVTRDKSLVRLIEVNQTFADKTVRYLEGLHVSLQKWDDEKAQALEKLTKKVTELTLNLFPQDELPIAMRNAQNEINHLIAQKCPTCGGAQSNERKEALAERLTHLKIEFERSKESLKNLTYVKGQIEDLEKKKNPYINQIADLKQAENPYVEQIERKRAEVNPFIAQVQRANQELEATSILVESQVQDVQALEYRQASLTQLLSLTDELRGTLLAQSIQAIENDTNRYLEQYFDAEIRCEFTLEGADNLLVTLQKSGNECTYKQLSKGQRGLLKLSFAVAVMRAASNRAGVHFENLFFDESLDGLDSELKTKAFGLFSELEKDHTSVMVIDHSTELRECFSRRFSVSLEGDASNVREESQ